MAYMLTVLGTPITKKRARTGTGVSKGGKAFRWAYTPDDWYEEMLRKAFHAKYPKAEPYGREMCKLDKRWNKWRLDTKNYTDMDLPKLELIIIFYVIDGKVGDLDNYIKIVKDALNGIAFVDDRQFKHYEPYIVSLDDDAYADVYNDDLEKFSNCETLERVEFIIREYTNPLNKRFLSIRELFDKDQMVIDYTARYYNDYRECTKEQLKEAYTKPLGINIKEMTKEQIIERLIQYDLNEGGCARPDGKIRKRK